MKKLLLLSFIVSSLFSAQHIVDQKNRTYIPNKLTVSVGDTIIFKNSDNYPHISSSSDPINGFNTGLQKKGEEKVITINGKSDFIIKCTIHPNMLMEVIVK